ncbi:MAG: helix-turn-helix transcriptional regulator [Clostridia bacterium]|nr:helix-turn-helix transcriptional regulator [Clostridia bacterium]
MMNTSLLKSIMVKHGDTQQTLATAMGLSLSRVNAKFCERGGAAFTQTEMAFIIERYHLSPEEAMAIFFATKVS